MVQRHPSSGIVGRHVFPFYVVCDVSRSMWDPQFLDQAIGHLGDQATPFRQIEDSLPGLIGTLEDDLLVRDTAHVSVIAFGDQPQVVLPLTPLNTDDPSALTIGTMTRQYATDYAAIFKHLLRQVREDVQRLTDQRWALFTPAIYFITDGNPQAGGKPQSIAEWLPFRQAFESPDFPISPTIVALGLGDVSPDTLRLLASTRPQGVACMANGLSPDALLGEIIDSIMHSIAYSSGSGNLDFRIPAGMTRLA